MYKKLLVSILVVILIFTGYSFGNNPVAAAEKDSSEVVYQYVDINSLTDVQKKNIKKGSPSETLTNDQEFYSFVYQKNQSATSNNTLNINQSMSSNELNKSSNTLDRGSLMKTGDTGTNVPIVVLGFILFGIGMGLLIWKKRQAKQILVFLAVLGGGSLLLGSSLALANESGSLKAQETVTVTKGTKETKKPVAIEGYTYVGYLHTSKNQNAPLPVPVEKGIVKVNYQDEEGKALAPTETLEGDVGKSFKTESKQIDGYDLKEVVGNATGNFTKELQIVTYKYTKEVVPAADVTVQYVDQYGKEIHDPQIIHGNVGETYDATTAEYKLNIDGYSLDTTKLPTNGSGDFSNQAQQVIYVYTKEAQDAKVTIKFEDEQGNPFILTDLTTFDDGTLVTYYPEVDQYHMLLDYNQQIYNQGQQVPDIVMSSKVGETYSLPEMMTFNILDEQGNIVDELWGYNEGILRWESTAAPTNREGTLSGDVVVIYQMSTITKFPG
ncbi:MucBP domain-containing protein [Listeria welshimeri]|nr:MucBP domain-containing protein [Listeria welshimeri]MBC2349653.1 MucBP domain-containing protein [Listeria welshimeri]